MPVTLENTTRNPRRMVTLNLTKKTAPVRVTRLTKVRDRRGALGTKISTVVVPGSVHIASGAKSAVLPKEVVESSEVKNAIAKGWIKVHDHGDAVAEPAPVETAVEAPSTPSTDGFKVTEEGTSSSKTSNKGASPASSKKRKRG